MRGVPCDPYLSNFAEKPVVRDVPVGCTVENLSTASGSDKSGKIFAVIVCRQLLGTTSLQQKEFCFIQATLGPSK